MNSNLEPETNKALKNNKIEQYFGFNEKNTNFKRETIGGLTTFMAMSYILFVNSAILSDAGMDEGAVFVATGLTAAISCLIMALWANYPIGLAPGMGLNAFFAYTVVIGMGIPWETAIAGFLVAGLIFLILTLTGLREKVIDAIPPQLKDATVAGIGMFIAFIGLQNAGVVTADEETLITLSNITSPTTVLALFGLIVTAIMLVRSVNAAIFFGMIITAVAGIITGLIPVPSQVVSTLPSLAPTFGVAITELPNILQPEIFTVVFTVLFVNFFDATGTIIAVAKKAGFLKDDKLPRAKQALGADAIASVVGSILGTSNTNSYIESASGVAAGARTGFASLVTAGCFLLFLFLSPLLEVVTEAVTAPALIIVGVLMASSLGSIKWDRMEYAIPAFVTIIAMPLTYSIANGIALGFIAYPILRIVKGEYKALHPIMYLLLAIFISYFIWLA
ncbi:putative MFS transporter, AGZA family, xanthine/uracil permease [Natribacillus halophilus]|uniref:Putative MFS transporter, AGZA family, xanthine/uracil permease n=1 Tax=Natribacillus halophilus TaxID=549003 RepID=A0A1G8N1B7_9BACI|nr:NCS2 family permease [Natribacillus halophilus]SDI73978.1 putative MFS transporter, AGZA family, xanthine/uracil permease [Natribacillus halophilus]